MLINKIDRMSGRRKRRDEINTKENKASNNTIVEVNEIEIERNEFAMVGDYTCHRK